LVPTARGGGRLNQLVVVGVRPDPTDRTNQLSPTAGAGGQPTHGRTSWHRPYRGGRSPKARRPVVTGRQGGERWWRGPEQGRTSWSRPRGGGTRVGAPILPKRGPDQLVEAGTPRRPPGRPVRVASWFRPARGTNPLAPSTSGRCGWPRPTAYARGPCHLPYALELQRGLDYLP